MRLGLTIVGDSLSNEDCVKSLQALAEAGCRHFIVRFVGKDQAEQLRRFTADVLPAFR